MRAARTGEMSCALCRRSSGLILAVGRGGGGNMTSYQATYEGREVATVYALQGFTWADSLDGEMLFLERI